VGGRIVLGVSGGIAAYKAVELLRILQRRGSELRVIMTEHATGFVNPRTFAVLSGHPVEVSQWERSGEPGVDHVELARWADLLMIAPATANILGKLAAGIADDALSTYALAHRGPMLLAPAMNTHMWKKPAVQEAVAGLAERGATVVAPESGRLACRDEGEGRLAAPDEIAAAALQLLPRRGPLEGLKILVTAGPTREPVDAVRFLSNRSSGRMGVALAQAAADMGALVTLLHGPLSVPPPLGASCLAVETAAGMGEALADLSPGHDIAILAAAVADFRPASPVQGKLDRRGGEMMLELEPVPDLAASVGSRQDRPYLVVFAAETGPDRERALSKMRAKGADAVVLNDISAEGVGMEAPENEVTVLAASGLDRVVPRASKDEVAKEILMILSSEILTWKGRA